MSLRVKQVESLLLRQVAQVLARGLNDPRVKGMVSVTRVSAAPDLKQAKVYVSVLPESAERTTLKGLHASARHVQSQLRPKLALKSVPHLTFALDEQHKKEQAVFAAIAEGLNRTADTNADLADADPDVHAADDAPESGPDESNAPPTTQQEPSP